APNCSAPTSDAQGPLRHVVDAAQPEVAGRLIDTALRSLRRLWWLHQFASKRSTPVTAACEKNRSTGGKGDFWVSIWVLGEFSECHASSPYRRMSPFPLNLLYSVCCRHRRVAAPGMPRRVREQ